MTNDDDTLIRQAAREICAAQSAQRGDEYAVALYLSGDYDYLPVMRLVEQGIRKGIEIGRSL